MAVEEKALIGCEEWCAFPSLGIPAVKARVDSGAKTSSLHAVNIEPFKRRGANWVSFEIHPLQDARNPVVRCEAPVVDRRSVRSSSGDAQKRLVVKVPVRLGQFCWEIEVTLTNRDSMGYRMLLGREAMVGRVLVDPEASFLQGELDHEQLRELYGPFDAVADAGLNLVLLGGDPEEYSNGRLIEAAQERGHQLLFLNVQQCSMRLDSQSPEVHHRGEKLAMVVDAVIPRIPSALNTYGCALTRQFEMLGAYSLNSAVAFGHAQDLLFTLQTLLGSGVPIPVSSLAHAPVDADHIIEMVGGAPIVVKLVEGKHRRGGALAETRKAAESLVNAFRSLQTDLLVQPWAKEAEGKLLRLLVIDGKVAAAIEHAEADERLSEVAQQSAATSVKVAPEERKLAIKAAKALDLSVVAVAMVRASQGPLLIDVDASPDLEVLEAATGRDIAGMMISAVERKLDWQRKLAVAAEPS